MALLTIKQEAEDVWARQKYCIQPMKFQAMKLQAISKMADKIVRIMTSGSYSMTYTEMQIVLNSVLRTIGDIINQKEE